MLPDVHIWTYSSQLFSPVSIISTIHTLHKLLQPQSTHMPSLSSNHDACQDTRGLLKCLDFIRWIKYACLLFYAQGLRPGFGFTGRHADHEPSWRSTALQRLEQRDCPPEEHPSGD